MRPALPAPAAAAAAAAPPVDMDVDASGGNKRAKISAIREIMLIERKEEVPYVSETPEPIVALGALWPKGELIDGLPVALVTAGDEKELDNMSELVVFEWIPVSEIPAGSTLIDTG